MRIGAGGCSYIFVDEIIWLGAKGFHQLGNR